MTVSTLIQAIASIFATPEYTGRIPTNVQEAISNGNFGQTEYDQNINNAIMNSLVDKIARQDIYAFEYNNFDASQYEKGYLPFGGIIEDDFIEAMVADNVPDMPTASQSELRVKAGNPYGVQDGFDPFKINYPKVTPSYYMLKTHMQYHVTTTLDVMKRAFTSEAGASNFIQRIRGVLPESGKLDKYLLFRNMLASPALYGETDTFNNIVNCVVAGSTMTAEESIAIVRTIRTYVEALQWNNTKYNKLGVLTSSKKENLVLFISSGIYTALSSAQYNAYHKDLDFGCEVQVLDGFGSSALTTGQFAVLSDKRAIKIYKWQNDRMDNIWNPVGVGYWNTYYSFGTLMGYAMHANLVQFRLTNA